VKTVKFITQQRIFLCWKSYNLHLRNLNVQIWTKRRKHIIKQNSTNFSLAARLWGFCLLSYFCDD